MITLYLVTGTLGAGDAGAETGKPDGGAGSGNRRRKEREIAAFIKSVILPIINATKAKPGKKKQKAIARQIIIASGNDELLPILPQFSDEIQQIGAKAVEAVQMPDLAGAQARYAEIVALIEEMKRLKELADEQDEWDIEELLLAA